MESSCTEVVLNGIPAFPERFNLSCHCVIWQRCNATCFMQSLKTFLCTTTSFHFNFDPGTVTNFVNMVLRRSHYSYESRSSTHCSRLTEYCRRWLNSRCSCPQSWQLSNSLSSCDSSVASTFYLTLVNKGLSPILEIQ